MSDCPGAADSPCKCEKIVNVKHNLLKPSKEDTRGKLSSLLRSEVRPSTELPIIYATSVNET